MIENIEIHNKIIKIIEEKGPSMPIQIAKELGMSSLFVSAFLSELNEEKKIKMSYLKVGGTRLYLLEGQEYLLENFVKFLHPKEAEAQLKLKENKILKDSKQEPAIRVALRSIRDFAIGFKNDEEIYWRYLTFPEEEIQNILDKKPKGIKQESDIKNIFNKKQKSNKKIVQTTPKNNQFPKFENPLITNEKKIKPSKSEFVIKTLKFIQDNYKLIQEKDYKPKEYNCIIQVNTPIGPMNFLTQAKDKKTVSETDIKKLLSDSQKIPLPAFIIYSGELSKKAQDYAEVYFSILKTKKLI